MPVTIQTTSFKYKNSNGVFQHAACIKGEGVPTGGTVGQVLRKISDGDYDTEWSDMEVATLEETAEIINNYGMGDDDSMLVETELMFGDGSSKFFPDGCLYYETVMDASDIAAAYKAGKSVIFRLPASDEEYDIHDDIYMQLIGFEEGDGFDFTWEDLENANNDDGGEARAPVILPMFPRFTFYMKADNEEANAIKCIVNQICINNKVYFMTNQRSESSEPIAN